jgi:hypothetical protein
VSYDGYYDEEWVDDPPTDLELESLAMTRAIARAYNTLVPKEAALKLNSYDVVGLRGRKCGYWRREWFWL